VSADQAPVLHVGTPWTACKSCGAKITFARSTAGKASPFEADDAGLWTIRNGEAVYLGTPDKQPSQLELGVKPEAPEPRFTSHFATCKFAAQHRKPR
jgi:hypothetical protein